MSATRYASVLGLGFGDCGKGRFIDAFTRRWRAHTVVRFNGGAQAGHNVVEAGAAGAAVRHHTFSQFGAGTFVPDTHTVLLDPMIVHPTALLVEAEALAGTGIQDALVRMLIDARCRITTPFHQAAGRLRERLRGAAAHGTCGVGVGETVRHALERPTEVLRYGDLAGGGAARMIDRLQAIRQTLLAEFVPLCREDDQWAAAEEEFRTLQDETLAVRWLNVARALARQCPPASADELGARLTLPGCVLFEGAQGVLLDEWHGFHPHTTWSSIHTAALEGAVAGVGIDAAIEHYGVLRTYLTRHGAGPLPTHDEALDAALPEPHNSSAGWQGAFRRGHPDAVLLRYALAAVGNLSGLLVSHLDIFQRGVALQWCESYAVNSSLVNRLPLAWKEDLSHQAMLTQLLLDARPQYAAKPIDSVSGFFDRVASVTRLPIILGSHGAASNEMCEF